MQDGKSNTAGGLITFDAIRSREKKGNIVANAMPTCIHLEDAGEFVLGSQGASCKDHRHRRPSLPGHRAHVAPLLKRYERTPNRSSHL